MTEYESVEPADVFVMKELIGKDGEPLLETVENEYVLQGVYDLFKIKHAEEFAHSWTDEDGGKWGPFPASIIEVKVNKSYNGESQVEGDIIRVYSPSSLSMNFQSSVNFIEGREYVFSGCWVIDETFADYNKKYNRAVTNNEIEKYADVYLLGAWSRLFPVENGKVMLYHGYFAHNDEIMKKYGSSSNRVGKW